MKSIIVGCGFGDQVYKQIYEMMDAELIRVDVDSNKNPDYISLKQAFASNSEFDTAHVCVPNYLHEEIAEQLAGRAKIVFVEKPGVISARRWRSLVEFNPETRFMMVKNNMWRDGIFKLRDKIKNVDNIDITWETRNRVPNPGYWFTNKIKAYGGVSKDIMPHLVSIMIGLAVKDWKFNTIIEDSRSQQWSLSDIIKDGTEYGHINVDGIYNVDDNAKLIVDILGKTYTLSAAWKTGKEDKIGITIGEKYYPLGLCPVSAYAAMILDAMDNISNDAYWREQFDIDMFIHKL